jgi:hypothetical protein
VTLPGFKSDALLPQTLVPVIVGFVHVTPAVSENRKPVLP